MIGMAAPKPLFAEIAILYRALRSPTSCWLAKGAVLLAILYLLVPYDLIPDDTPIFGYWDEAGMLFVGFVCSRALVPAAMVDDYLQGTKPRHSECPTLWQHIQFTIRIIRSDLANFFLYQHRGAHAFLITGKNSGTHWLKFMLSCALAKHYKISRPHHASGKGANDVFGDPRRSHSNPLVPRIGSSHTVPSIICSWTWLTRSLPHPPVVVLVRDIRAAMSSHYAKWQDRLSEPFSSYVQGDPSGRRYKADIWWYIRFFNRWGDLAQANPTKILVVRYEDLQVEPEICLRKIAAHWQLGLDDEAFAEALRFTGRDAIRSLLDPSDTEIAVPSDGASFSVLYSETDEQFVRSVIARYLRHDFGYEEATPARRRITEGSMPASVIPRAAPPA